MSIQPLPESLFAVAVTPQGEPVPPPRVEDLESGNLPPTVEGMMLLPKRGRSGRRNGTTTQKREVSREVKADKATLLKRYIEQGYALDPRAREDVGCRDGAVDAPQFEEDGLVPSPVRVAEDLPVDVFDKPLHRGVWD